MFARITVVSFCLWISCVISIWLLESRSVNVEPPQSPLPKKSLQEQPACQIRHGVQKDIWTLSGKERLHFRLRSKQSVLTIQQNKRKFSAVETLEHLECCMQESVHPASQEQHIRYITAPRGTYSFPEHRFVADEVLLSFYQGKGTSLPPTKPDLLPFLSGIAEEVVISAVDQAPIFSAYHLKAEISPTLGEFE